jgi:hypothetical protein
MAKLECKCIHCGKVTGSTLDPARVGTVCHDYVWQKLFKEGARRRARTIRRQIMEQAAKQ